jgi:hypothetical protein
MTGSEKNGNASLTPLKPNKIFLILPLWINQNNFTKILDNSTPDSPILAGTGVLQT